jgi:hypothetical protein
VRWSVGIEAEGDRVLVVEADSRDDAIGKATSLFLAAAKTAGLPEAPIVRTEAISEHEELDELSGGPR